MAEQNMTVWQRLSQTFGPNSLLNQDYPTFKFDKKELLRTNSRQEYETEKLQAQQTYYIANQWAKVENKFGIMPILALTAFKVVATSGLT